MVLMEILLFLLELLLKALIYGSIIGVIVYFLLPWIFDKFVSPSFNASYIYKSKDFKKQKVLKILTSQESIPKIEVNRDKGVFEIVFGEDRQLQGGAVEIIHNQIKYSNLNLKSYLEKNASDNLGAHKLIKLTLKLDHSNIEVIATIKEYPNQFYVVFGLEFPNGLSNTATGKYNELITSFPCFKNASPNTNIFTYRDAIFCHPSRGPKATSAPVVFYDDDLNCFIVSPLDGFLNTAISIEKDNFVRCGIQGEIKQLPEGFTQEFIIYFGKGVNKSMEELGDLLLKYHDSQRKDPYANLTVSHLSYWTDNGAHYYYRTEKGLSYEDSMVAIKDYFKKHNIPIESYNFDSWWYLKYLSPTKTTLSKVFKPLFRILGGGLFGNTIRWETDPRCFTTDLKTFHDEKFNKSIIAHGRRWHPNSPYLEKYDFITYKDSSVPLKKDFWDWLMKYAKDSGIDVYEQDWMKNHVKSIPFLRENINAQEEWLKNMALSAKGNDVDVFYCMQTPGMVLYSVKHPNINIARSSGDYNHRWPPSFRYIWCTQANILLNMVGINSHQDVFRSKSLDKIKYKFRTEKYPEFKCLVQILTAGLVAPGDRKEDVNWPLLKKTCRNDGLLLKPDKALTPNDLMFKKHRKYYIADTCSIRQDLIWRYVLIANIWPKRAKESFVTPDELGYDEDKYILYDYYNDNISPITKEEKINVGFLKKYEHRYYILCPITKSGLALIGCPDKFVTCSKKQFPSIESDEQSLSFSVEDIKDTEVSVLVYSEKPPSSIQLSAERDTWDYIAAKQIVKINLKYNESGIKTIKVLK